MPATVNVPAEAVIEPVRTVSEAVEANPAAVNVVVVVIAPAE
tara:strand:+ start:393 stop:518 length:126 start_codon:yes stop_codon:yes gene_type:complete